MKQLYTLIFILFATSLSAQIPTDYYTPANGLTGFQLKTKLKEIIDNVNNNLSTEFMHMDQGDNLDALYQTSDIDNYYENDGTILDIYSENPTGPDPYNYNFPIDECGGSFSMEGECYNKEHTIPKSIYGDASPMVNDAHQVIPTDGRVNGLRGSFPFGVVDDNQLISQGGVSNPTQNGSKAGGNLNSGFSAGYTNTVFEPLDEFKGDIARIYFYFVTRYESQVNAWSSYDMFDGTNNQALEDTFLSILFNWHLQDPVSQKEIDRNNIVFNYQNNRNPFVDHPEFVAQIWNITPDTQAPTAPTNLVASNPTDNTIDLTWTASTDDFAVASYDIYVDNVLTSNSTNTSFTVTGLAPNTPYCFTIKAKDTSNNESGFSNQDCETTTNTGTISDCASEDFLNMPANSSQYTARSWSGNNGMWSAEEARTDQTINGRAILIDFRDNNDTGSLISPTVAGGIGTLTVTTQRIFSGSNGTLDVLVNGNVVGTIAYSETAQTVSLQNINIENNIQVTIEDNNSGNARVGLDDLSWTCYTSLSVDEFNQTRFKLYPNPARHTLNIETPFTQQTTVAIYSMLGERVMNTTITGNTDLDISALQSGMYLVKIGNDLSTDTLRLIKQ